MHGSGRRGGSGGGVPFFERSRELREVLLQVDGASADLRQKLRLIAMRSANTTMDAVQGTADVLKRHCKAHGQHGMRWKGCRAVADLATFPLDPEQAIWYGCLSLSPRQQARLRIPAQVQLPWTRPLDRRILKRRLAGPSQRTQSAS